MLVVWSLGFIFAYVLLIALMSSWDCFFLFIYSYLLRNCLTLQLCSFFFYASSFKASINLRLVSLYMFSWLCFLNRESLLYFELLEVWNRTVMSIFCSSSSESLSLLCINASANSDYLLLLGIWGNLPLKIIFSRSKLLTNLSILPALTTSLICGINKSLSLWSRNVILMILGDTHLNIACKMKGNVFSEICSMRR